MREKREEYKTILKAEKLRQKQCEAERTGATAASHAAARRGLASDRWNL